MSRWLAGKSVCVEGEGSNLVDGLIACGATVSGIEESDILVHVAWSGGARPTHELSHAEWRCGLEAGLDARFRLIQRFAAARRREGRQGAVVFVGSPERAGGANHAAAAGALANMTKSLAVEWARDGLRVNAILSNDRDASLVRLVAFLASDYAAYVTGTVTGDVFN